MTASDSLHGDLQQRVVVDTAAMPWTASPSPAVWRKRVHRVGPAESGQVTTVVRFDAHSTFRDHGHPDGEEILVLDGVFSDQTGDWSAGSYLLNPEGFRHAPHSQAGCTLFVKLRQYPGLDRRHVTLHTARLPWNGTERPGVERKPLYAQVGYTDASVLERWASGANPGATHYPDGAEIFILQGRFTDELGSYGPGCWLRLPAGFSHHPRSEAGCTIYCKTGGLAYLENAPGTVGNQAS